MLESALDKLVSVLGWELSEYFSGSILDASCENSIALSGLLGDLEHLLQKSLGVFGWFIEFAQDLQGMIYCFSLLLAQLTLGFLWDHLRWLSQPHHIFENSNKTPPVPYSLVLLELRQVVVYIWRKNDVRVSPNNCQQRLWPIPAPRTTPVCQLSCFWVCSALSVPLFLVYSAFKEVVSLSPDLCLYCLPCGLSGC